MYLLSALTDLRVRILTQDQDWHEATLGKGSSMEAQDISGYATTDGLYKGTITPNGDYEVTGILRVLRLPREVAASQRQRHT